MSPTLEIQYREMTTRELTVRSKSVDVAKRSFEAVVATEQLAVVRDWRTWELVDEILVADGGNFPDSVVLLDDHNRYSGVNSVIGSATNFRREGDQWVGTGIVGRAVEGNIRREQLWQDVADGHIRAVSIGYQVNNYVDIPAGKSQVINGRTYTAGERVLRVTTDWQVHELSLTPIGADSEALIRSKLQQRERLPDSEAHKETRMKTNAEQESAPAATEDVTRSKSTETVVERTAEQPQQVDTDQLRAEAAQAERTRIQRINDLAEVANVPAELRQASIDGGHTVERASEVFVAYHRKQRADNIAPAIHVQNSLSGHDRNSLVAAMMLREGVNDPTRCWPSTNDVTGAVSTRKAVSDAEVLKAVERGDALQGLSLIEIVRRCLEIDGIRCEPTAPAIGHAIANARATRAASTMTLTGVMTTSYAALMVAAYEEAGDTTQGWTSERMVANYLLQERTAMQAIEGLAKRASGKPAEHTTRASGQETYRVSEYSRQFVIDDQDLINDSLGALDDSPQVLGAAAARLRPDLVYSILLANANMRDGAALFVAGHNNLKTTAALAVATLEAARAAMLIQTENGVNLNIMPKYLIVPGQLQATAETLVESSVVVSGNTTPRGDYNSNSRAGLIVVPDARLDNGVVDPSSGTTYSGSATTWFLSAAGTGRTIEVGYIRQLGRNPRVRSKVLDEGRFGIAFDVQHSVGAKAIDWRGLVKNTA